MRKRRSRRGRKNAPKRARRNYYSAGMLANKPKKRRGRRARRNAYFLNRRRSARRRYRPNPAFLGFQLPPMDAVLYTAAGLIGPNLVSKQILTFVPASWKQNADGTPNQLTIWATKILSVLLPAWAIGRFIDRRAGSLFLIGGSAGLAMDAVKTFAPGIIPGLGAQPLLGSYFDRPRTVAQFPRPARTPMMIAETPERLNPQTRF